MQDENSDDGDDVDFHDDFNFQDQEKVQKVLSRLQENSDHRSFLKWRDDARPQARPRAYTGDSDRTHRRKKEAARAHAATFEDYPRITAFFKRAPNQPVEPTQAEETSESESDDDAAAVKPADGRSWKPSPEELDLHIRELRRRGVEDVIGKNVAKAKAANKRNAKDDLEEYDKARYLCILRFFTLLRNGESQMDASLSISKIIFDAGPYRAVAIRDWAKQFRIANQLNVYKQGRHPKRTSLIDDEVVKRDCGIYLRSLKPDQRTAADFCRWFSKVYYVQRYGAERATFLGENTARAWFKKMGWYMWEKKKGLYVDGHERPDVVHFRTKFLNTALVPYQRRMARYSGPNMEIETLPILQPGEKRVVQVNQDESIVHANDGRKIILVETGHEPIFKKGEGASKMISGFSCPCHGPLVLTPELAAAHPEVAKNAAAATYACNAFPDGHSFVTINVGKKYGDDGYWTSEHLDEQLRLRAIPIFNLLHPDCEGLWLFDNSQNHHALAKDALRVTNLNLSDGGVRKGKDIQVLRKTKYLNTVGQEVEQSMQLADGRQKGLKTILKERGLWPPGGLLLPDAKKLLAAQPDFIAQKGMLVELLENCGKNPGEPRQHILMFPKYHCEFNFIENLWGRMKVHLRRICKYDFDALQISIPEAVASVPVAVIRRYAQRCDRFMDAYRPKVGGLLLTPEQVARAVKKFKSHRCIPGNVATLFPEMIAPPAAAAH